MCGLTDGSRISIGNDLCQPLRNQLLVQTERTALIKSLRLTLASSFLSIECKLTLFVSKYNRHYDRNKQLDDHVFKITQQTRPRKRKILP